MKFKSDLEMWHKIGEFAETLKKVAMFQENSEIRECKFYEFDEAFEEHCHNPKRTDLAQNDHFSKNECWKCPYRELKGEGKR